MRPIDYYQQQLDLGKIKADFSQRWVIEKLDSIFLQLMRRDQEKNQFFRKIFKLGGAKQPVRGLYLWESVGIGKTFLIDCFYHCLTIKKMRLHFHQFMQQLHQDLKQIQGQKNPLAVIAQELSEQATVICFDEFFVSNIADAMLLGELLRHLFLNGVTLVTSSNISPDLLYKEGLQRENFLPAIALIQKNTEVIHLHSQMDYRKQHIRQAGVFYTPINRESAAEMENCFIHFSGAAEPHCLPITICDRTISIVKEASTVIWFDFEVICRKPRSQDDYLCIAKQYRTVLIQNVRRISPDEDDLVLLFMFLVDIFYDAHCRLVISSHVPIDVIYIEGKSKAAFQRTLSRLIEMQSENYVYPGSSGPELTAL